MDREIGNRETEDARGGRREEREDEVFGGCERGKEKRGARIRCLDACVGRLTYLCSFLPACLSYRVVAWPCPSPNSAVE